MIKSVLFAAFHSYVGAIYMFDLYIMYSLGLKSIILVYRIQGISPSLVRADDLNLINHYMLYKKNMTSYKHLAFIKIVTDAIDKAARLVNDLH